MEPLLILPTKLYIPPSRKETVNRPYLISFINDNYRSKTVLLSAPAGFGKTTLVCDWIRQSDVPVAWFSIDEGDDDTVVFFSYLISAFQTLDLELGASSLSALQAPRPDYERVLTTLILDLGHSGKETVLVLEDYYTVTEKQIHGLVEFLIKHKPGNLHLFIATRSDPLLPLHRYRARDQLAEIRAGNLSFSDKEAYSFFNKVMGLHLSTRHAADLNQRTEGWITGLQMAAISLKSHGNIDEFVRSFTGDNRYVMDYLLEEVIALQTDPVKSFLLQTSVLERFSRDLCTALTGFDNCNEIIDTLDRGNFFLISLDNNGTWYRYHHLFCDLLRKKLKDSHPGILPGLHKKASKWFAENDLIPEAL